MFLQGQSLDTDMPSYYNVTVAAQSIYSSQVESKSSVTPLKSELNKYSKSKTHVYQEIQNHDIIMSSIMPSVASREKKE